MAEPACVVALKNVSYAYNGKLVLRDVDLQVEQGDFLVVWGPNGGGKSTLLKLMLGLQKPMKGDVRLFGRSPREALSRIGYMPQRYAGEKGFPITVFDLVRTGLRRRFPRFGFSTVEKARVWEALERVEMEPHARKRMDELSGGMRQRAALARALVSDPDLLLLDEPMANIDPAGRFCFYEFLSSIRGSKTIVMVSHEIGAASAEGVTGAAAVNGCVIYRPGPHITREMLDCVYGKHDHHCPFGEMPISDLHQLAK